MYIVLVLFRRSFGCVGPKSSAVRRAVNVGQTGRVTRLRAFGERVRLLLSCLTENNASKFRLWTLPTLQEGDNDWNEINFRQATCSAYAHLHFQVSQVTRHKYVHLHLSWCKCTKQSVLFCFFLFNPSRLTFFFLSCLWLSDDCEQLARLW